MKTFSFYLEAWKYCADHKIELNRIVRLNWKQWAVQGSW